MRKKNWSQLVKKVLNKHLLSQAELADICNVSQQTVSSWKIGTRVPGYLHRRKLLDMYNDKQYSSRSKSPKLIVKDIDFGIPDDFDTELKKNPEKVLLESFGKLPDTKKRDIAELVRVKLLEEQMASAYNDLKDAYDGIVGILDNISDAVWCFDFDKNYVFNPVYVSPNFTRMTGHEEAVFNLNDDKKWLKIIHPDDREDYKNFNFNVSQNKLSDAVFDYRIINPDGRSIKVRDKRRVVAGETLSRIYGTLSVLM